MCDLHQRRMEIDNHGGGVRRRRHGGGARHRRGGGRAVEVRCGGGWKQRRSGHQRVWEMIGLGFRGSSALKKKNSSDGR
jgi:hypothetical protein